MNVAECYNRFLSGDENAIDEIIRDYKDELILYLHTITGDFHTAEDYAIDTFVKLFTDKPHFKGDCKFKTWLYTIGHNIVRDNLRKSPRNYDISIDNISPPQSNEDIEKSYTDNEDKLILQKSLKNLNYDYSRVLYLFYFKEMTQKEICEEMEKNPKQIKNLLFRAKAALKKELEKEGYVYDGL